MRDNRMSLFAAFTKVDSSNFPHNMLLEVFIIFNAYDTTVGAPFQIIDKINMTVKTLVLLGDLERSDYNNVYFINHENGKQIPQFIYPMSLQSHDRSHITIMDTRAYTDKKGRINNQPEFWSLFVTACLQQDLQEGKLFGIKSCRYLATKGFARAVAQRIGSTVGLNPNEQLTLTLILAHYFICLYENPNQDYQAVSLNVIQRSLGVDIRLAQPVIEEIGFIDTIPKLIKAIINYPGLYKVHALMLKDFVKLGS